MRFHNITMIGKMVLQKLSNLPVFNASSDEGRIFYNQGDEKVYIGTGSKFQLLGSDRWGTLQRTISNNDVLDTSYLYPIDTSTEPITAYLDSSPTSGDVISVYDDKSSFSLYTFTMNGNGNQINGFDEMDFSIDDSVISFIFNGDEWKADVGGLYSASPSGSVNFGSLGIITDIENSDNLIVQDASDGQNKKISTQDFIKSWDIDTSLATLSSAEGSDYYLIYDVDADEVKKISSSSAGSGLNTIDITPDRLRLDDTDTGINYGSVFNMFETLDFEAGSDGACWFTSKFPDNWDDTIDMKFDVSYSLDTNDSGKTIRLKIEFWSIGNADSPSVSSPSTTVNNDVNSTTNNINKYYEEKLITNVSASDINSDIKQFVIKLTRDVSEDTYIGKFQLISLRIYQ